MKSVKIICCSLVCSFTLLAVDCRAQDTLWWAKEQRLTWEDFQGFPDTTEVFEALTYSGIAFSYTYAGDSLTFKASAYFNRAKSWRLPIADSGKLRHEQVHFDITELFTRKLTQQLRKLKTERTTVQQTIRTLLNEVLAEKDKFQHYYDQETHYGTMPAEQRKWEKRVACILQNG